LIYITPAAVAKVNEVLSGQSISHNSASLETNIDAKSTKRSLARTFAIATPIIEQFEKGRPKNSEQCVLIISIFCVSFLVVVLTHLRTKDKCLSMGQSLLQAVLKID
jgi:hypothetical protein